jgi:hypothetical protein
MKGTLMSETPIYDALMDEYKTRSQHLNPVMEDRPSDSFEAREGDFFHRGRSAGSVKTFEKSVVDTVELLELSPQDLALNVTKKFLEEHPGGVVDSLQSELNPDGSMTVIAHGRAPTSKSTEVKPLSSKENEDPTQE